MLQNKRILDQANLLIVEDDVNSSRLLKDFLTSKGAKIVVVNNGSDAITTAVDGNFDLIILDLRLPGENGFVVAEELRKRCLPLPPAIVVTSAFYDRQNRFRAFESGVDAFFSKPVDLQELVYVIKNRLDNRQLFIDKNISLLIDFNRRIEIKMQRNEHGNQVAALCNTICKFIGNDNIDYSLLSLAAKLHDLGLLFSKDLCTHAEIGATLIKQACLPSNLAMLVSLHHQNIQETEIDIPNLLPALKILQISDKALEVYPTAPDIFEKDFKSGFLPSAVADYLSDLQQF